MTFGIISYTEQGAVSIDSEIKGFALTGIETYTATVDAAYRKTGWEIRKAADEILVLGESTHLVAVRSIDVDAEIMLVGVLDSYMSKQERWTSPRPPQQASIKIYRFSSRVPTKKGVLNIYTDDGHLAFTSAQPMLRPAGYFPVPKAEQQKSSPVFLEDGIEQPMMADKPLGVVLDLSVRRFRFTGSSIRPSVSVSMMACYKVTPKYICRRLVRRGLSEQMTWGGTTFPLFPSRHWMFPIQEGLLVFL
ncbi:MAG: hypothetical protein ACFNKE_00215 [Neisseria elongata]